MNPPIEKQYRDALEELRVRIPSAGLQNIVAKGLDDVVGSFLLARGVPLQSSTQERGACTLVPKKAFDEKRAFFFALAKTCFLRVARQDSISDQELSLVLLHCGVAEMREDFRELLVCHPEERTRYTFGRGYRLRHPLLEAYFAAVYLATGPAMGVVDFVREVLPVTDEAWTVLEILAGLCGAQLWSAHGKNMLPQMMDFVFATQLPVNEPIAFQPQFLHILGCLKEANDPKLYEKLLKEYLTARTIVFSSEDLKLWRPCIAAFVTRALPPNEYWTCFVARGANRALVDSFCNENPGYVAAKDISALELQLPKDTLVLTTRKAVYLRATLAPFELTAPRGQGSFGIRASPLAATRTPVPSETSRAPFTSRETSRAGSGSPTDYGPYGYITKSQYENKQKLRTASHFHLFKDLATPHLQVYSMKKFEPQYKKNDHLWMAVATNMRNDWYDVTRITPIMPIHWVKVQQPNGVEEVERQFRNRDYVQRLPNQTAELVVLNSQCMNRVEIVVQLSNDPVAIALQSPHHIEDQGYIGCDFLLHEEKEVKSVSWFECRPFDIKSDKRIGRLLPLPPKKVEIGVSSVLSNIPERGDASAQGQSQDTSTGRDRRRDPSLAATMSSFVPRQTKPYFQATADAEAVAISEHLIKKEASNGFDQPGYCFYSDLRNVFRVSCIYALPDTLSTCRLLREGGNGVVLEVNFSGEVYAVKRTAFRWREVLIMPKLHHKNILKLVAMMIGRPLESHPKRRYVYHFYPKMSNDLGRSVGSFEKHCLRTLCERYSSEPLLLKKIKSNFRHVARELLSALEYLHSRPNPIVHRDVKVSNVLVRMVCDCHNPLVCVCRQRPEIVLSDFDASLELEKDGKLEADPPRGSSFGIHSMSKVFHVSAVGTIGYKSPEGSIYCIGNSREVMPPLSTKADVFSFGLVMSLLFLNQEGPKSQLQMAKMLLSINQTVQPGKGLSKRQQDVLKSHRVEQWRPREVAIKDVDMQRILPLGRARRELTDSPEIINFLEQSLNPEPSLRSSAKHLLEHPYLQEV